MGNWGYNKSKYKFGIVENLILKRKVALSEKTVRDGAPAGIVDTYVKVRTKLMVANIFVPHVSLPCTVSSPLNWLKNYCFGPALCFMIPDPLET